MCFRALSAAVAGLLMLASFGSLSSSSAAPENGCKLANPPAGAANTTIKSWVDPRPCDWAQKFPLFAPPAPGDGSLQRVQTSGNLSICAETDQPPGVYSDPSTGKIIGYEPDILQNLVERLGIKKYSYVEVQFPSYIPAIQAKKCDAVLGVIGATSQRAQAPGMRYTWPYLVQGDRVIVLKDSSYQHISDLKGQKIAVVPGSVEDLEAKQIVADLGGGTAVAEFQSDAIAYTAVFNRQAAAVIDVTLALIQRPDADKLRQLPDPPPVPVDSTCPYARLSVAAITTSTDNDLNLAISVALEEMKEDGTLEKIFTSHKSYLPGVLDYVRPNP